MQPLKFEKLSALDKSSLKAWHHFLLERGPARLGYDLVSWGTILTFEIYTSAPLLHMQSLFYLNICIDRVYAYKNLNVIEKTRSRKCRYTKI